MSWEISYKFKRVFFKGLFFTPFSLFILSIFALFSGCGGDTSIHVPGLPLPAVVSISPYQGAVGVVIDAPVTVTFSTAMDTAKTELAFKTAPVLAGTFAWGGGNTVMTFTPGVTMTHETTYTVTVGTGSTDVDGLPFEWSYIADFSIGFPPTTTAWTGSVDYLLTGATMAVDGGDADTTAVDILVQPTAFDVDPASLPSSSTLQQALLYWGGTQNQPAGECASLPDDLVTFTPPGGTATALTADACVCDSAGAATYDIWTCKKDVTWVINSTTLGHTGTYSLTDYTGQVANNATDNASVALLLVYEDTSLPARDVKLDDTLLQVLSGSQIINMTGLSAGTVGNLTYYTLDGDLGGAGTEQVLVDALPGAAAALSLIDANNPIDNPMNGTINTTPTLQTGLLGVDIDKFDISPALTAGDTSLNITYTANADKWWHVLTVVGVDQ